MGGPPGRRLVHDGGGGGGGFGGGWFLFILILYCAVPAVITAIISCICVRCGCCKMCLPPKLVYKDLAATANDTERGRADRARDDRERAAPRLVYKGIDRRERGV